jgi:F0F1-type ATP synthase delta subunit
MKVARSRLAQIIDQKLTNNADLKSVTNEVAAYLLSENRTGELESIMRDVMQLREQRGIIEVQAVDAFPLTDQTRGEIIGYIRQLFPDAQDIIVSEVRDASVIGGTKLILANQQLDMSVRSKLNRFKRLTVVTGGA